MAVKPVPDGFTTVTPYLVCAGAADAITFYQKAFGAREVMRMPGPHGSVAHAELQIGTGRLMLSDETPQSGKSPKTLGGSPVSVFLYLEDVDKLFKQAVAAGATVKMPLTDMFWGDRFGIVTDPFGHDWQMATHVEDVSPQEMQKRMAEMGA